MSEYRYLGRGWSGKRYYMEMTLEETKQRESFRIFLGVIIGVPAMAIIMSMAAGLI